MKTKLLLSSLVGLMTGLASFVQAAAPSVPAPEIAKLALQPNGTFTFDKIAGFTGHFRPDWTLRTDQTGLSAEAGYPKRTSTAWETRVPFWIEGSTAPITLDQRLEKIDGSAFVLSYEATHPTGVPTQEMFLQFEIPVETGAGNSILVDRVPVNLPAEPTTGQLFMDYETKRHTVVLPGATGTVTIEGEFSLVVQDQRQWKREVYSVRLRLEPREQLLTRASLDVKLRHTPRR